MTWSRELALSIPVLACHQHFLADVGKDLLEASHAQLRGLFRASKVRPKLRALVRDLGPQTWPVHRGCPKSGPPVAVDGPERTRYRLGR